MTSTPFKSLFVSLFCFIPSLFVPVAAHAQNMNMTAQRTLDPDSGLTVVLIGTGIPLPNPDRACAATAVIAGVTLGFAKLAGINVTLRDTFYFGAM